MIRNGPLALIFHALLILFVMAPLIVVFLVAFAREEYITLPWSGLSLRWFQAVLADELFLSSLWLSARVATLTASLSIVIGVPAALALGRYSFPGREAVNAFLLSPIPVPAIVMGIAFLRFMTQIGWNGTIAALVVCHVIVITPFVVRILFAAVVGGDRTLPLAALSLGATPLKVFWRITVPQLMAGITGAWMMAFLLSFDELTISIFVASTSARTLPVWLFDRVTWGLDPSICAASVIIITITLLFMVVIDRLYGLERLLVGRH